MDGPSAFSLDFLVNFAKDVATGMSFVAERGVVHRDLAARNCLVAEDYTVKVRLLGVRVGESVFCHTRYCTQGAA